MLSDQQFERMRRLALSLAGIELVERHRDLLDRRSRRVGICDRTGWDALLASAEAGDPLATRTLVHLLTTKFTGFFRQPLHFEIAAEHARQAAEQRGRARLWSAASATGEEPYSLAMSVIERFGRDDPPVSILATDVDAAALEIAQRGEYAESALQGLAPARRTRFVSAVGVDQRGRVSDAARALVEFRVLNLIDADWPVKGPFDVIFCRNVLMYLDVDLRNGVVRRFASLLAPGGRLMLDPVENLGDTCALFTRGAEGVYARRQAFDRPDSAPPVSRRPDGQG